MLGFLTGLISGCLLGIAGTLVLLLLAAGIAEKRSSSGRWFSTRGTLFVLLFIPGLAVAAHSLGIRKSSAVLLLMLAVLVIAKLDGLVSGLGASAVAAAMLGLLFMPPLGSFMAVRPSDQLLLAFFLLGGILCSRLIGPSPKRTA